MNNRKTMPENYWASTTTPGMVQQVNELTKKSYSEDVHQDNLKMALANLAIRREKGENVDEEIQNMRIHLATLNPANTRQGRFEEKQKEVAASMIIKDRLRTMQKNHGETEEQFYKRAREWENDVQQVQAEVRQEVGLSQPKPQPNYVAGLAQSVNMPRLTALDKGYRTAQDTSTQDRFNELEYLRRIGQTNS